MYVDESPACVLLWHGPPRGVRVESYERSAHLAAIVRPSDVLAARTYRVLGKDWWVGLPTYATWFVLRSLSDVPALTSGLLTALDGASSCISRNWQSEILLHRAGLMLPPTVGYATWKSDIDSERRPANSIWERFSAPPGEPPFCRWDLDGDDGNLLGTPTLHEALDHLSIPPQLTER